jgi:DNA polymerase III delta subunit
METSTLKFDIKTNSIRPYYIFTGEEIKVQDIYIEKLASGKSIRRADSFSSIARKLNSGMLLSIPKCYVIRDDIEFTKEESIWGNLEAIIGSNLIVWVFTSLDKRSKFYKHFKDLICEFNHLSEDVLLKYVQKEIDLSDRNARELIQICENDYSRILLEIDKIKSFMQFLPQSDCNYVFKQFIKDGTIYQPPRDAIFMWADAVLKRQKKAAFGLLRECIDIGEASLTLLSVLYNNTKQVLQVQSCESKDVVKTSGLTPWQVKCARDRCGYYRISELVNILELVEEVEKGIKIGTISEELAVPYVLVRIL